jgi:ABC-type antimicrobial peptide transport system permease subunit
MLKNYFKLAYRQLLKNKLSSIINISGLSVAIGCSIIFFLLLYLEYTSDHFHKNAENIYMVVYTLKGDEKAHRWGDSPEPLGPALKADFPQIERVLRVTDRTAKLAYKNKIFNETIRFVDPCFMDMFTFPLKLGIKTEPKDQNWIIISEPIAIKYFGSLNPLGEQITIILNKNHRKTFFVRGVAEKFPINASFHFGILASYKVLKGINPPVSNQWAKFTGATFIQLSPKAKVSSIAGQTGKYVQLQNKASLDRPIKSFGFEPLPTLSWESQNIKKSISSGSTPEALIIFFLIGIILLVQACFNYVNIALASGTQRLREIGIRKVVGGRRFQLVKQFLGENLLLCLLALVAGLLLTEFLLLPGFFELTGHHETVSLLYFFNNQHVWIFLVGLLLLTALCAGAYPALYISRLKPVSIFAGKFKIKSKKRFSSVLLSIQFGVTFLIICLVITFWQNNNYQLKREWGYNQEHVISIPLEKGEQFRILKNALDQNPNVSATAGSTHHIGRFTQHAVVEIEAQKHEVIRFDVGLKYLETLGIRLKEGRFFNPQLSTDLDTALVVNQQFIKKTGWEKPLGKAVRFEHKIYKIIGVVENFHYQSFYEEIEPVFVRLVDEKKFNYFTMRLPAGTGLEAVTSIEETWKRLFPDSPYRAFFQDSVFDNAFRSNEQITKIFAATAFITLIISCMGLFGLVSLMISKQLKELSIRKILGASVSQISMLISRRYILLLSFSILLTLPFAYGLLNGLLDGIYRYHMSLGVLPFIVGVLILLFTAILTIASQIYKAAVQNPIDSLRYE